MTVTEYPKTPGCHRYSLRVDGLDLGGKPDRGMAVFLMCNPATAVGKEERFHHTRNICCRRAQSWGYGTVTEVNLFALRASDKERLFQAHGSGYDLKGPENNQVLYETVSKADLVVVAWGKTGGNRIFQHRVKGYGRTHSTFRKEALLLWEE